MVLKYRNIKRWQNLSSVVWMTFSFPSYKVVKWGLWTGRTPGVWPECHRPISVKSYFLVATLVRIISLFLPRQFPNKIFVTKEEKVPCVFADIRTNSFWALHGDMINNICSHLISFIELSTRSSGMQVSRCFKFL